MKTTKIEFETEQKFTFNKFTFGDGTTIDHVVCKAPSYQQIMDFRSGITVDTTTDKVQAKMLPVVVAQTGIPIDKLMQLPTVIIDQLTNFIFAG